MTAIAHLRAFRQRITDIVEEMPTERLFKVPEGFGNHIAWNAAHLAVTQQLLHYRLSGLPSYLGDEIIEKYRKGTGPEAADEASFRTAMDVFNRASDLLEADFQEKKFQRFEPYQTSVGVRLETIEDALLFNNFHEGIHLGYILAMKKLV